MYETARKAFAILDTPARRMLIALFVMTLIAATLEAVGISMIFPILKLMTEPEVVETNTYLNWAYEGLGLSTPGEFVVACTAAFFGLFLAKTLFMMAFYFVQYTFAYAGIARLSNRLFGLYLNAPYLTHIERNSTVLIRNVRESTHDVYSTFVVNLINLAVEVFLIASVTVIVVVVEPVATLAAGAVVCVLVFAYFKLFGNAFERWGHERLALSQQALQSLQQSLGAIKESKILRRTAFFARAFTDIQDREVVNRRNHQMVSQLPRLVNELVLLGGMSAVIIVVFVSNTLVSDVIASLGLFAAAALRLTPSVNRITSSLQNLRTAKPAVNMVYDELQRFEDGNGEPETPAEFGSVDRIEFQDVGFTYPSAPAPALRDIDTVIRHGESIGLVGASGAGKTTLADIVLGLLTPTEGRLLINGEVVSGTAGAGYRVGYVPQAIYFTDDSLRRNIAFGIDENEIDDTLVNRALALAHLDAVVAAMPDGLDTSLREQGSRFSGGQRQRVGIARALYHDPEILVLDEATSALDSETEYEISRAIQDLKGRKTIIVIAHRLSTVRSCDRLLFLDDGRLIDEGRFDELLARNARFRRLASLSGISEAGTVAHG